MHCFALWVCSYCSLVTCVPLMGQVVQSPYYFDHIGNEDGLYSRQVRHVVQSSDGFLWLGSNEGLTRYDGKEFTLVFDIDVPDHISPNRYVERMAIDQQDRIWLAINEHVAIYNIRKDSWTYLVNAAGSHRLFPLDFALDETGNGMWIGCSKGLFHSANAMDAVLYNFAEDQYATRPCNAVTPDANGNLWIANTFGIFKLDITSGVMEPRRHPEPKPQISGYTCSYLQGDSVLWVGSWGHGLVKHTIATNTSKQYNYAPARQEISAVYAIHAAPDQAGIWVGTLKGLKHFDPYLEQFTPIQIRSGQLTLPGDTDIYTIDTDHSGSVWIGSAEGLIQYDQHRQDITPVRLPGLGPCMSVEGLAHGVSASGHQETWIFTPYCEYYIYDHTAAAFRTWPNTLRKVLSDVGVFTFAMDTNGRLWIATNRLGMLIYNTHSDQFDTSSGMHFRAAPYWVNNIIRDRDGTMWFCTQRGLFSWNEQEQTVDTIHAINRLIESGVITASVNSMVRDANGSLWVTTHYDDHTSGSIICLRKNGETIVMDRNTGGPMHGVHDFRGLVCSGTGNVYVTTDRGLFAIRQGDPDSVFAFPEFSQLPGFSVNDIVVDPWNGIWIGSHFGVSRFDEVNNTMIGYSSSNSLLGLEALPGILCVPALSAILVTQHTGFDIISAIPQTEVSVPPVYCMHVRINGMPQDTTQHVHHAFSSRNNDLALQLAFPYFTNPSNTVFRYMLRGYDDHWQTSSSGYIVYNNLPTGHYDFVSIGITGEGKQSANQYTWSFAIRPVFYKTWWFQLGILVLVVGITVWFYRHREMQRKRLQQIRDSIARDLHDEMGSNLSAIRLLSEYEMLQHPGVDQPALQTIRDKSNEVMESMYDIIWSIHPEKGGPLDIAEKIRTYMAQSLEPQGVQIEFRNTEVLSRTLKGMSLEQQRDLYLILKEAIHNISKHANAGKVVFEVYWLKGQYHIVLQDNGVGFDPDRMQYRHGLGNMRTRAKSLGGQLLIHSAAETGTRIEVIIAGV